MMNDDFESRLRGVAREFPYPPAPPLARATDLKSVAHRGGADRAWRLAGAVALLLVALLAVPQVRAGLLEFIQLGAVRINLIPPTATTPATPLASLLDLAGETTLAEARTRVSFSVLLPEGFGPPDRVFVQDLGAPAVVLVWLNAEGAPRLSLHEIGPGSWAAPPLGKAFDKAALGKFGYELIEVTDVNGNPALWVEGERVLIARDGEAQSVRLVDSPALIWETFGVTYRLEGDFTLEEMRAIAESLR
jgi:hypothetical protein